MYRYSILALVLIVNPVSAHDFYSNWTNKEGRGCCNNQDCDKLADENERFKDNRLEVKIENTWCEVQPKHYLKTGNAPNWDSAHICVLHNYNNSLSPCERFLCYQPKPKF